jgi:hypothetical protein
MVRLCGMSALLAVLLSAPVHAQEATNTPAATQPSVGKWYLREKVQVVGLGKDPETGDRGARKVISTTTLTRGLTRNLSASVELPVTHSTEKKADGASERGLGLNDPSVSLKWRPYQRDLSPVDSVRLALYGGLELPAGSGGFGSNSVDPFAGAVLTAILGRHGFNQSISYKLNTGGRSAGSRPGDGPGDALRYDTAYLYRVFPAVYSAETTAATYLTLEMNGQYETNGDNEILLGPGILYEARTYALEASAGFPVVRDVQDRAKTDLAVTLGFRLLF